jgi:ubiquinone/menaquinone biosynthesis C-methylase UbiE
LLREEIEHYCNVEVTEHLREGGIHAHPAWGYWFEFLQRNLWHTSFENEIRSCCEKITNPRLLSLGCGYGGIDLDIARMLNTPHEIVAIDINGSVFGTAQERAAAEGLNIRFEVGDLNFIEIAEESFDVVYAHASLHHVLNLENLFFRIHRGLKRNGRLVVQDIIGKTQVLFWKPNVTYARRLVRRMPKKYTVGADPDAIIEPYRRPSVQVGMEGIRQEEIESQIARYFAPVKLFKFGSFMRLICTNQIIGKSFDPGLPEDRAYLEHLFSLDLEQVATGRLRPTEMFGVFARLEETKLEHVNDSSMWDTIGKRIRRLLSWRSVS